MINKSSIRSTNLKKFQRCIDLRKQGLSYSEIQEIVPIAKSTLNNWLTFAGLTLTKDHLEIQLKKRLVNHRVGTEASKITRINKINKEVLTFLDNFNDKPLEPLLVGGCLLYEAEGQKKRECKFSNSDYKLVRYFLKFIETYFSRNRNDGISFRLYIHQNRKGDLQRILKFWSLKLGVSRKDIAVTWKKHIARIRTNNEYVGQMLVRIKRSRVIIEQIHALSAIILEL